MNKNEYLRKLDILLESLPYDERRDIMYDYEEHFKSGLEDGKTEEEITKELGSPERIAAGYIPNFNSTPNNNYTSNNKETVYQKTTSGSEYSIVVIIGMFFFNVIFIGLYLAIWGVLVAFFAVGIAFAITALVLFIESIFGSPIPYVMHPFNVTVYPFLGILTSVFMTSLGGLVLIGTTALFKGYARFTVKYIEWNKQIVRRG